MSEQLPNIQENNQEILNDIQSLQNVEQELFNNLESNTNLSPEEQNQIIQKINGISNMRINLYQTLGGVNNFFQNALVSSRGTLQEQKYAIEIIENELNKSKRRLHALEQEKNNKIRLIEINKYYGEKYSEHSNLMKTIIFILIPVIILTIIKNKGYLPIKIYYILIVIISIIGAYFFWIQFFSIIRRDNMNYDTYNWYFDPNTAPKNTEDTETSKIDPWLSKRTNVCYGDTCCSEGQIYDKTLNICVTSKCPTTTESFVINVLTKGSNSINRKSEVALDSNIRPHESKSFINY
jgi:hypothetical protein